MSAYDLVDKLDGFFEDWTKWYSPSDSELKRCQWIMPDIRTRDGTRREFDPVNDMYCETSSATGRKYYYKESGGNMTEAQVAQVKQAVKQQLKQRRQKLRDASI